MKYEDAMKIRLCSGDYTRNRQLSIFCALEDISEFSLWGLTGYVDTFSPSLSFVSLHIIRCPNVYCIEDTYLYNYIVTCLFAVHVLLFRAELSTIRGA